VGEGREYSGIAGGSEAAGTGGGGGGDRVAEGGGGFFLGGRGGGVFFFAGRAGGDNRDCCGGDCCGDRGSYRARSDGNGEASVGVSRGVTAFPISPYLLATLAPSATCSPCLCWKFRAVLAATLASENDTLVGSLYIAFAVLIAAFLSSNEVPEVATSGLVEKRPFADPILGRFADGGDGGTAVVSKPGTLTLEFPKRPSALAALALSPPLETTSSSVTLVLSGKLLVPFRGGKRGGIGGALRPSEASTVDPCCGKEGIPNVDSLSRGGLRVDAPIEAEATSSLYAVRCFGGGAKADRSLRLDLGRGTC
jgi:hypothetical protein